MIRKFYSRVDEDYALEVFYEFTRKCHNMNIIVKNGGDISPHSGENESSRKTLANITKNIILNLNHKKERWCLAYQYEIWISRQTENLFRGYVP